MLHTQMARRKTSFEFIKSRVIRIVPIYWLITLFIVALFYVFPSLFRELLVTPIWALTSLFFTSSVFVGKVPIVHVGWTLEWEMLFYLIFSVALLIRTWSRLIIFVGLALAVVSFVTKNLIVFEFLLGIIAAYIYHKKSLFAERLVSVAIFLIGVLGLGLSLIGSIRSLELSRFFVWGVPSFFIVLGVLYSSQIKSAFLAYLGDASYSIYLVQILTIPAFYRFSTRIFIGINIDLLALACLAFSVSLGCVAYSAIERPMTVRLRKFV